jgi:hypothetical protein
LERSGPAADISGTEQQTEIIMTTIANAARVLFVVATVLGTTVACSTYVPADQQIAAEIAAEPAYSAGN